MSNVRFLLGGVVLMMLAAMAPDPNVEPARERMVEQVRGFAAALGIRDHPRLGAPVLDALGKVPRHLFVPAEFRDHAYENRPLPIGEGQTISQPYIVAVMTELLQPHKDDVVLEVGTGSGYQAAILAELVEHVWTVEIVEPLARESARLLKQLGYHNVSVRAGDGYAGWAEHAPFDAIIVTAGAPHIPPPLVEQLKAGGRMVIPVGPAGGPQQLLVVEKSAAGKVTTRNLGSVVFVPLTGPGADSPE